MLSTLPDAETICNSFLTLTLPHITGESLLQHIITNHRLQCENASSLTYFGQHGMLAAILYRCAMHSIYRCCVCCHCRSRTNMPTTTSTCNTTTRSNTDRGIQDQQVLSFVLGKCSMCIEKTMGNICQKTIYCVPTQSNGGTGKYHATTNNHAPVWYIWWHWWSGPWDQQDNHDETILSGPTYSNTG